MIEGLLERIIAEAEERSRFCPWCLARLENCAGFCNDVCREDYAKKLMPPSHRDDIRTHIPSMVRIRQRRVDEARSAAWRAAHEA